jgi:hypothetical protein
MVQAYSYEVPVSYTVDVSLAATPQGIAEYNTNNIAIFTNEPAAFSELYKAYLGGASGVATDFGSDSLTYKLANELYAPVPNFTTGGGNLYIFPFNGTNATPASLTTGSIADNLSDIKEVSDGSLSITIDGNINELSGINFTTITTVADVVTVLKNLNLDVNIEADGNTIVFTSRKPGELSGVTINTISDEGVIDISSASYLNVAAGTSEAGQDAGGETLAEAVARGHEQVYFGGVLTTQVTDNSTRDANARAIQSLDCIYYDNLQSLQDISELGATFKAAGLDKTRTLAYSVSQELGKIAVAGYASIAKSVNYSGTDTANTLNLKTITGIVGDPNLNGTYVLAARDNGVDIYGNTGGLSVIYSNDNNGYTDDVEANLWHKKATEVAGFNYLRQTNTKIPQTEAGMTGLKTAYAGVCEQARRNGTVAPGTWNGSVPFGDPETFKRNIEETGYYIYSIPVALQNQTEREARKAPVVQIALKRSGAFHFSQVIINVQR